MKSLSAALRSATGKVMLPSFAIALCARIMQLVMTIIAARLLLPEGYGIFTFTLGVALIGGRLGGLGWPVMLNRFIPRYTVEGKLALMHGLLRAAHGIVFLSALVVAALCAGTALWLGPESHLYAGMLLGSLLLPVLAFRTLYRNVLAALRLPQNGLMIDELLPATLTTCGLLVLLNTTILPETAVGIYIAGSVLAVGFGAYWIRRKLPEGMIDTPPEYLIGAWMRTALPALVGISSKLLMNKTDVLMLAPLATMSAVGLYGAALRVTALQTAPVIVLSTVINARVSEAFAAGRDNQGKRLFYYALGFSFIYSSILALLIIVFSEFIMNLLFGEAFADGAAVLALLAIAQVGGAMNTPTTSFMLMTGREVSFGKQTVVALLVNIGLNLWLIPTMGAIGAALATCVAIWLLTGLQVFSCLKIIRSGAFKDRPDQ